MKKLIITLLSAVCMLTVQTTISAESTSSTMTITVNNHNLTVDLVNNTSTETLLALLKEAPITYEAHDYGNFEKVGDIGHTLPQNNEDITTEPGDVILYLGKNICIYYDTNQWDFTRLGKIRNVTQSELKQILGDGNVTVKLSLGESSADINPSDTLTFASLQRTFAGTSLSYRKAKISNGTDSGRELVIYLHGGSSCGTDNETQMNEAGMDSISNYLVRKGMNATFVVPQCPDRTKGWAGIAGSVKALLDFTVRTDGIDTTRIYIFGGSMGGTGTWKILSTYPSYFAAGMPCAANPTGMNAVNVATTPVYNVMGLADMIMDADVRATAESFVSQLKALGDDARYETVEGWSHETTCIQSYTTERLDWMFGHERKATTLNGDMNGDGKITMNDVNMLMNIYLTQP